MRIQIVYNGDPFENFGQNQMQHALRARFRFSLLASTRLHWSSGNQYECRSETQDSPSPFPLPPSIQNKNNQFVIYCFFIVGIFSTFSSEMKKVLHKYSKKLQITRKKLLSKKLQIRRIFSLRKHSKKLQITRIFFVKKTTNYTQIFFLFLFGMIFMQILKKKKPQITRNYFCQKKQQITHKFSFCF